MNFNDFVHLTNFLDSFILMDKLVNEQFKTLLLREADKASFDIDTWNRSADLTKMQIRRDLKNQIVSNPDHFGVVQKTIEQTMQQQCERLNMYRRLAAALNGGLSQYVLKMMKSYVDSHLEIYELRKIRELDLDTPEFKTYTDAAKFYNANVQDGNYVHFQSISDHIGSILQNKDYYKEHCKRLMDPIARIIESDDSDDITVLVDLANALEA